MTTEVLLPTWRDIERLVDALYHQLQDLQEFEVLLTITRAGMFPTALLSQDDRLDIQAIVSTAVVFYDSQGNTLKKPEFLNFPRDGVFWERRVLIVDEVWESGSTMTIVRNRVITAGGIPTTAVLHYKHPESQHGAPDHFSQKVGSEWIVYPWDPKRQDYE